ncbi:MAG: aldehyde dehydrogenase family protein, partial [Sutterella wadsworthensis]|nr:aldehyde dehydrogenase family protein [Sutterella wadsworthensis]
DEGAEMIAGEVPKDPGENEGYFIRPTVFVNVRPEMKIAQEEIFGPVLSVLTYRTLDEAEAIANGTPYGLCGAVFGPKQEALDFARRIRSGNVYINDAERDLAAPFGGFGASGIGREGGIYGLEEFTELKAVFDHSTF